MRQSKLAVFLAIDAFLSPRGKPLFAVEQFLPELEELGIPCVWLSGRSRAQLDEPRRAMGHTAPFIGECGSGVFLPEDYFHLRPEKTLRLGRFTCIPVAAPQPAAKEALEVLSEETGVSVVALSSLSPGELAQNTGLPRREAELLRMRDFSELFFFAGANDKDLSNFLEAAGEKKLAIRRQDGALWSLAVGASEPGAIREVSKLYDRALRSRMLRIGVAPKAEAEVIATVFDRVVALVSHSSEPGDERGAAKRREFSITAPDLWERVAAMLKG